ncbi:MAG TPA: SH3 domain-containing protein [Kiloniellales bacterium]|nr:SH3 domain-containing protein [Kiloniellales bacterium]
MRWLLLFVFLLFQPLGPALAQEEGAAAADVEAKETLPPGRSGLPVPRFVSLRANEVNLRAGPGFRYPIEWVYRRAGQPVEVVDEYETWRRIRDWEGTLGWVHQSMLQNRRSARVVTDDQLLLSEPKGDARPVARVERGAIGTVRNCNDRWCEIDFAGLVGWLPRDTFYGVYPEEMIN